MSMSRDELFVYLRDRLVEVLEIDPEAVTLDADLADVDADSIDLIEIVNQLEHRFGITIEEQKLYDIETIGQLLDLVENELARNA